MSGKGGGVHAERLIVASKIPQSKKVRFSIAIQHNKEKSVFYLLVVIIPIDNALKCQWRGIKDTGIGQKETGGYGWLSVLLVEPE